ncbi:hypothetical protein [Parasphingopyxis sp.]|uniref:hypothetical protein n=1 Tax=Parasphingopyxis sp. TaxID=1920299 RepID=UPI00262E049A|nr:hypothetical protein [Parasphingopyxis sp.]
MAGSRAAGFAASAGAAVGGLIAGNILFPLEPGQAAIDALPFTLIGAFLILWPMHAVLARKMKADLGRYAVLAVCGFAAGGLLLGLTLAIAGVSHPKALDLALIGASYGGLTAICWSALHWAFARIADKAARRSRENA